MADLSADHIGYLVNHLFLPPRLPAVSDDSFEHDDVLLELVIHALEDFSSGLSQDERDTMQHVISALSHIAQMRDNEGGIDERRLLDNLKNLHKAPQGKFSIPPRIAHLLLMLTRCRCGTCTSH